MESITRRGLLRGAGAASLATIAGCSAAAARPRLIEATPPTTLPPRFGRQVTGAGQLGGARARQATDSDAENQHRSIIAFAAVPEIQVFEAPNGASEVTHVMDNPTATNGQLVFLVVEVADDWLQVLLPVRPNGSTGWVRLADVTLAQHFFRMQVDLADFRMRVFQNGAPIFDAVAGVASNNTPTPGGVYYLTELILPPTPTTAYGALAYGLSGFSEVFETFNGGPGQLGIHGTNDPETLGTAVSAGCIRLHNEDVLRLSTFLPLGVPVTINA